MRVQHKHRNSYPKGIRAKIEAMQRSQDAAATALAKGWPRKSDLKAMLAEAAKNTAAMEQK